MENKRKTSTKPSTGTLLSVQPVQNTKPEQQSSPNLQQLIGHKNQNISLIISWTEQSKIDRNVDFKGGCSRCSPSLKSCHDGCPCSYLLGALQRCRQVECEAFAVINYANNYVTWRNECRQEMGEEVLDVT